MPIPLLGWIVIAVVGSILALGVLGYILEAIEKKATLIGPSGSGKTTFLHFLKTGNIPRAPERTSVPGESFTFEGIVVIDSVGTKEDDLPMLEVSLKQGKKFWLFIPFDAENVGILDAAKREKLNRNLAVLREEPWAHLITGNIERIMFTFVDKLPGCSVDKAKNIRTFVENHPLYTKILEQDTSLKEHLDFFKQEANHKVYYLPLHSDYSKVLKEFILKELHKHLTEAA